LQCEQSSIEVYRSISRIPAPAKRADSLKTDLFRWVSLEDLTELAWLSPGRFARLSQRLADVSLDALRRKFDANFEGSGQTADLAWFPAWVLTDKPGLAPLLRDAQPSRQTAPERATRLLLQILSLERQGNQHELVERRKALRDLHAGLYWA
jgi:hypothetical protein